MELVKPDPLIIGGHAHYTLTSYEPVSVEVVVPGVRDEDVELALAATVAQAGGTPDDLNNDIWIHKTFPEVVDADDLRDIMREQLLAMHAQMAEEQKAAKCAEALVARLVQRVPQGEIARMRSAITQAFAMSLAQDGLSEAEFLQQAGMRHADLEMMFDQQAQATAEREAALGAWSEHYLLQASDDDLVQMLDVPEDQREVFLDQAHRAGQIEQLRQAVLQDKALRMVMSECNCSYVHEQAAPMPDEHPHLKLV